MLKNFLTITVRQLGRHPGYTLITIAGLAVGMACCLMIGLYVEDELSFDRFHDKADRLFVVVGEHPVHGKSLDTHYSLASMLESDVPDVEQAVRFWDGNDRPVIREETQMSSERPIVLAEPAFFEVFSFPAVIGDPVRVLNTPDGVVITESMARLYFGEENPIGKTLKLERVGVLRSDSLISITVGAVVKDVPNQSSVRFDLVAPLSLLADESFLNSPGVYIAGTVVLTRTPDAVSALDKKMAGTVPEEMVSKGYTYHAVPLTDLHLSGLAKTEIAGHRKFLYIFGSVALLILLIAAVNYVNLVTAHATKRAREVGVRKTMGAGRAQLARQFLGESVVLGLAALVFAFVLTAFGLVSFGHIFDKELTFRDAAGGFALPLLCGLVLIVTIAAGAYPAFVLSRFRPVEVLRGAGTEASPLRGRTLRQCLVVFQFTISAALIFGTAIIYRQLQYVQNKDLGFSGEQVIVVDLPRSLTSSVRTTLKQRLLARPGIRTISIASAVPGAFQMGYGQPTDDVAPQNRTDEERIRFKAAVVDYHFLPTLDIRLLAGRRFSENNSADAAHAYVLNRVAVQRLGWTPDEAVGKAFKLGNEEAPVGEVVGVVENFHITSLHEEIDPVVLQLHTMSPAASVPFKLVARLAPDQIQEAVLAIKEQLGQVAPGISFQYLFLDNVFDQMYRSEQQLSRMITTFAGLAIFIACLGLFGLASFTVARRTKEIGVRKVLGASAGNIVGLISADFLKLIGIAFVVAAPAAYFAMGHWLENFVYHVTLTVWPFLLAGLAVLGIALLTVSYQSVRAALADPVKSLRYE